MPRYVSPCAVALACLLVASLRGDDALDAERAKVWLVRPKAQAKLSQQDREARNSFIKLIEDKQTKEFRDAMRVIVPETSSGVPEKYELSIYGKYCDSPESADL